LDKETTVKNEITNDRARLFHRAIQVGDIETTRTMLAEGISPEVTVGQATALFKAAAFGTPSMIDLLVDAGADPKRILETGTGGLSAPYRSAINGAALFGKADNMSRLLDLGADPRVIDHDGRNTAHAYVLSAQFGSLKPGDVDKMCAILDRMYDLGADVNAQDRSKQTVLHAAVTQGAPQAVVKLLVERGAGMLCPDQSTWSPFHLACTMESLDALEAIISAGVDINSTVGGRHALHLVNSPAAFELVMAAAPDIEVRDGRGQTPLCEILGRWSLATWKGKAIQLIAAGARLDARDNAGVTPRDLIEEKGITEISAFVAAQDARNSMSEVVASARCGKKRN
jgi:ankyrin repeat protein